MPCESERAHGYSERRGAERPHSAAIFQREGEDQKDQNVARVCACICITFMAHVVFGLQKEVFAQLS